MKLTAKKQTAQMAWGNDLNASASPNRSKMTPEIIGLRTNRYGPLTTNSRGGSQGARVPFPSVVNRHKEATNRTSPKASRVTPTNWMRTEPIEEPTVIATLFRCAIQIGMGTVTVKGKSAIARMWRRVIIQRPLSWLG